MVCKWYNPVRLYSRSAKITATEALTILSWLPLRLAAELVTSLLACRDDVTEVALSVEHDGEAGLLSVEGTLIWWPPEFLLDPSYTLFGALDDVICLFKDYQLLLVISTLAISWRAEIVE